MVIAAVRTSALLSSGPISLLLWQFWLASPGRYATGIERLYWESNYDSDSFIMLEYITFCTTKP